MKVLLFGATGMVGQGVLRECLLDAEVESVLSVARAPTGQTHPKLREITHRDFSDFSAIAGDLAGIAACFFCLGVSSSGMNESDYHRVTYDFTLAAAKALLQASPQASFSYVSGAGTDSSEAGRWMWARVKGKTENALLRLGFRSAYMFRPGYIQPVHGATSKTRLYRAVYGALGPLYPLWQRLMPRQVLTTQDVGRAMLQVAKHGTQKQVLESGDLRDLADAYAAHVPG
jgi:uncharacterized protein YbjT (DUF2867 family)